MTKEKKYSPNKEPAPALSSRKRGRPPGRVKRVKFTTMIDPVKRDQLKHISITERRSLADILDELIAGYIEHKTGAAFTTKNTGNL